MTPEQRREKEVLIEMIDATYRYEQLKQQMEHAHREADMAARAYLAARRVTACAELLAAREEAGHIPTEQRFDNFTGKPI